MQGWLNMCKEVNVMHYSVVLTDKTHMSISIYEQKASEKIQHVVMIAFSAN
jgi:hypothetical protein